jgi:hypothetical protein
MMCHLTIMRMSGSYRRITLHIWWMNLLMSRHIHLLEYATVSPLPLRIITPDTLDLFGNNKHQYLAYKSSDEVCTTSLRIHIGLRPKVIWCQCLKEKWVLRRCSCFFYPNDAPTKTNSFTSSIAAWVDVLNCLPRISFPKPPDRPVNE